MPPPPTQAEYVVIIARNENEKPDFAEAANQEYSV
jgi:hypothetical protein